MRNFWEKLKERWGVKNNFGAAMIFLTFAITGSASVKIIDHIKEWTGVSPDSELWIKIVSFIGLVLPVYNVLLLIVGSVLGQHEFFKKFIINFFKRILFIKTKK